MFLYVALCRECVSVFMRVERVRETEVRKDKAKRTKLMLKHNLVVRFAMLLEITARTVDNRDQCQQARDSKAMLV